MTKRKPASGSARKSRPALTPEARENQLIAKAYDLVEQRLEDGTATSQETTHFLKLGSTKARLELEKLRRETELMVAKRESLESTARMEELYTRAINAIKKYSGNGGESDD